MSEMPERIWALPETKAWLPALDGVKPKSISTTYVRADLVAELVKALEACKPLVDACHDEMHGTVCIDEPDDEPVACGTDADGIAFESKITFGKIRNARAAIDAALARAKGGHR